MTIHITLTPESEAKLRSRAAFAGKDISEFAREALEEKLAAPETFGELFRSIHEASAETEFDPEEADALVEEVRNDIAAEKRAAKKQ